MTLLRVRLVLASYLHCEKGMLNVILIDVSDVVGDEKEERKGDAAICRTICLSHVIGSPLS